jgi:ubiquinone/menaquinone biosynthesis C-methylase UbiE
MGIAGDGGSENDFPKAVATKAGRRLCGSRAISVSGMTKAETARVRRLYEKEAPRYDRTMGFFERILFRDARSWVCDQARGDVLEFAVGTGLNLPYYPPDVRLVGVELTPAMLERAQRRAAELGMGVDLRVGDVTALEFADESFDTVICTFSLCTIPDDRAAVAEAWRVLRPGGLLVLAEHVRRPRAAVRAGQRLLEPLAIRFSNDHLLREPLEHLRAVGFEVERLERYGLGIVERALARRPG